MSTVQEADKAKQEAQDRAADKAAAEKASADKAAASKLDQQTPKPKPKGFFGTLFGALDSSSKAEDKGALGSPRGAHTSRVSSLECDFGDHVRAGWLLKLGNNRKYQKRYCILREGSLYWYHHKPKTEHEPTKKQIPLQGYVPMVEGRVQGQCVLFKLVHPSKPIHQFATQTEAILSEWVKALHMEMFREVLVVHDAPVSAKPVQTQQLEALADIQDTSSWGHDTDFENTLRAKRQARRTAQQILDDEEADRRNAQLQVLLATKEILKKDLSIAKGEDKKAVQKQLEVVREALQNLVDGKEDERGSEMGSPRSESLSSPPHSEPSHTHSSEDKKGDHEETDRAHMSAFQLRKLAEREKAAKEREEKERGTATTTATTTTTTHESKMTVANEHLEKEKERERERVEREKERVSKEKTEKEKVEKERVEKEKLKEKIEKETREKVEKENKEKVAKEKLEKESAEKAKADKERLEKVNKERTEKERIEKEKSDKERVEKEKVEKDKSGREKERVEKEKTEKMKLEKEKADKEKIEKEKFEKEKREREREKIERDATERLNKDKREKEERERQETRKVVATEKEKPQAETEANKRALLLAQQQPPPKATGKGMASAIPPNSKVGKLPIHEYPPLAPGTKLTGMPAMLHWAQRATRGFPGVQILNFTKSWQNGLAFAALCANWRPDVMDYWSLDPSDALGNLQKAFKAAEKMGISMLLDAEDVVDVQDAKSLYTQMTMYHRSLNHLDPAPRPWEGGAAPVAEVEVRTIPKEVKNLISLVHSFDRRNQEINWRSVEQGEGEALFEDLKSALPKIQHWKVDYADELSATIQLYNRLNKDIPTKVNSCLAEIQSKRAGGGSLSTCASCGKPLSGRTVEAVNMFFHADCFKCYNCSKPLVKTCINVKDKPHCDACGRNMVQAR